MNRAVRRDEILFSSDFLNGGDSEIERMNEKKKGKPYSFPDSFILVINHVPTYLHIPYMQTKGVINGTEKTFPNHPSYGHRCKRINRLNIEFNSNNTSKDNDDLTIALDSTGIKVTNKGQWISHKWNTQKKGALQIHIAIVNIQTNEILALEITYEKVHDSKMLNKLIDQVLDNSHKNKENKIKIKSILAYGANDINKNFQYLKDKRILLH